MKLLVLLFPILIIFSGCDKCRNTECFTPPETYLFDVRNAETEENLFTNGTFTESDITITDENDIAVDFVFVDENDENLILINTIGWQTEEVLYTINIKDQVEFTLFVNAERVSEDCCSFTRIHEVEIEGIATETDPATGVIYVLVD